MNKERVSLPRVSAQSKARLNTLFEQDLASFTSSRIVNNQELRDETYGLSSFSEKRIEPSADVITKHSFMQ